MSAALLSAALLLALACSPAPAQAAQDEEAAPSPPLGPGEVARVGDESLGVELFHRYLAMVHARLPEGERATQQLLLEALVETRAAELGVDVDEAAVDALARDIEARAREAGAPEAEVAAQLEAMRPALRLAALQKAVVAAEEGLAVERVSDGQQAAWLAAALEAAAPEEQPLTDALALRFSGGELTRVAVGRRLAETLPPREVSGVLTELIGLRAIEHRAEALGLEFTAEEAARELAEREALVASHPSTAGVSYEEYLSQVHKRSPGELVASPKFKGEVLLRLMVEQEWTDERLRGLFEEERPAFEARYGEGVTFAAARPGVLKEARQRTYRQLLEDSRIKRRF